MSCTSWTPPESLKITLTAFAQNKIWIAIVQLATELTAWLQMLALTGTGARRWEPKRLR